MGTEGGAQRKGDESRGARLTQESRARLQQELLQPGERPGGRGPAGAFPHHREAPALPRSPGSRGPRRLPQPGRSLPGQRRKPAPQAGGWARKCQASSQVAMATQTKRGADRGLE